jgi:hypothetical protein
LVREEVVPNFWRYFEPKQENGEEEEDENLAAFHRSP